MSKARTGWVKLKQSLYSINTNMKTLKLILFIPVWILSWCLVNFLLNISNGNSIPQYLNEVIASVLSVFISILVYPYPKKLTPLIIIGLLALLVIVSILFMIYLETELMTKLEIVNQILLCCGTVVGHCCVWYILYVSKFTIRGSFKEIWLGK
jgi:hypothetical protein